MVCPCSVLLHWVAPSLVSSADPGTSLGEWAVARLQAEAAQHLQESAHSASDADVKDRADTKEPFVGPMPDPCNSQKTASERDEAQKRAIRVGRYHCIYEKVHGNLCLDAEGVQFEKHLTASEKWRLKYTELKSVQKVRHSRI